MRCVVLLVMLIGVAHASPAGALCHKLSSCGMALGADCPATFEGVTQPYVDCIQAAACDAIASGVAFEACEAKAFGGAPPTLDEVEPSPAELGLPPVEGMPHVDVVPHPADPVPEPQDSPAALPEPAALNHPTDAQFERLARRACVHSVQTCKVDPSLEVCLQELRQIWIGSGRAAHLLELFDCYARSTCESVRSEAPQSASACGAYYAQDRLRAQQQMKRIQRIQNQHHQTMMSIIGNMGGGSTRVYDQNGNYLYSY